MKRAAILMKYLVFLLGCGLVLAGFTSWFANPTDMQIVFSALAAILGALLVTLGLAKPPKSKKEKTPDEKLAEQVIHDEDEIDAHNSFHSPSDVLNEDDKR